MKFSSVNSTPSETAASWLLVATTESETFSPTLQLLDETLDGGLTRLRERGDLLGKAGELTILPDVPQLAAERLLILGLGPAEKLRLADFAKAFSTAVRRMANREGNSLAIALPEELVEAFGIEAVIERAVDLVVVNCASHELYKNKQERYPFMEVKLCLSSTEEPVKQAIQRGKILGEAVNLTRELVNRHPDDIYPETFAQVAADIAADLGMRGEILDEHQLADEKMGALLAVARGSARPPRMVVLRYEGGGEECPTIALVGKGVTFDSGGLSIKPSDGMISMKSDMAGAATVLGVLVAASKLKLPVNLLGVMGLVENMTGGDAYKLGSVLTARNGTTIEVHNTDAEGRLVLADALCYAVDEQADKLIDLATLTGACVVALGEQVVGAFSNDEEWCQSVIDAARGACEEIWQLPMYDHYSDQLKSEFADCKNVGTRWGGAITAAKFLEKFVDGHPWVHLDIAGPSYADASSAARDAGGTGVMVRGLIELLSRQCRH